MRAVLARCRPLGLVTVSMVCMSPLLGCANYIFKTFDIDRYNDSVSMDAKQRVILTTHEGGKTRDRKIVCAEPSPDAISAMSASASGSGAIAFPSLLPGGGTGSSTGSGGFAASSNEAAASLAMRTQTIQLLRDGYYRLCEAYMNGAIDQHQYNIVLVNIDRLMVTLLGVDGIAGTRNVAPVAISPGLAKATTAAGAKAGDQTSSASVDAAGGFNTIGTVSVSAPGAVQSEAIANIILDANSRTSYPGLCIALLSSGELRLDNPGQYSVMKSCDYLLNGVSRAVAAHPRVPAPVYKVSKNAADAQQAKPPAN